MDGLLTKLKSYFEVLAYFFGALFLLLQLVYGQFNAGMEVAVDLERASIASPSDQDNLAVLVKLKRGDIGRLEIKDMVLEITNMDEPNSKPSFIQIPRKILAERDAPSGKIANTESRSGMFLPPGDATQIAYLVKVSKGAPIHVDATVSAQRTGFWSDFSQWRASAISLPENADN